MRELEGGMEREIWRVKDEGVREGRRGRGRERINKLRTWFCLIGEANPIDP